MVFETISRKKKEYLIAAHIPFIVQEKQIYLPFLGIVLQEVYNAEIPTVEQFQPSAQILFFTFHFNLTLTMNAIYNFTVLSIEAYAVC